MSYRTSYTFFETDNTVDRDFEMVEEKMALK